MRIVPGLHQESLTALLKRWSLRYRSQMIRDAAYRRTGQTLASALRMGTAGMMLFTRYEYLCRVCQGKCADVG